MQRDNLKIGTRSSALALAQAEQVRRAVAQAGGLPPQNIEIVPMSTAGDRVLDKSLSSFGGKGLFTQEIEAALTEGRIDMAVHSAKDMPAALPQGLHLAAFLRREDPRDAFIGSRGGTLAALPAGAKIGTSSIRRQALLRRLRPDLEIVLLRGNIETRLKKLESGAADGAFLAYAGLKRLNLAEKATEILDIAQFVPAPGQGAIAIESRSDDAAAGRLLAAVNDAETALAVCCERSFMAELDGSCRTPLGAYARTENGALHFCGMILAPDGSQCHEIRAEGENSAAKAALLGREAAKKLKAQAGAEFFAGWH